MVRTQLRAERIEKLEQARQTLAANPLPPMTPEEIQAEIDAYRAERQAAGGLSLAAGAGYQYGRLGLLWQGAPGTESMPRKLAAFELVARYATC